MADGEVALPDVRMRIAARRRLFLPVADPGTACAIRHTAPDFEASTAAPCGRPVGCHAEHALCCPLGPWRNRAHDGLVKELARLLRNAGAVVDTEVMAPEFYLDDGQGGITEARMDLRVQWPNAPPQWLDITIATTCAEHSALPGAAAACAARRKVHRYGPEVIPFAVEFDGRISGVAAEWIAMAAAEARRTAALDECWQPGAQLARQLTAAISRCLVDAASACIEAAIVHPGGIGL